MTNNPNRLSALNTHWKNRSLSSITSDAATFHSAHVELPLLRNPSLSLDPTPQPRETSQPHPTLLNQITPTNISKLTDSTQMARQDSGFSDGVRSGSTPSSRRTSTSSTSHRQKPKRTPSTSNRPSTKRASRSSPTITQLRTSTSSKRPPLPLSHHSTPPDGSTPYQFFQFPTLTHDLPSSSSSPIPSSEPNPEPEPTTATSHHPPLPPPTCQYWTSDSTRRLEYAAIDAASQGVRGFFTRLVPDCMLPTRARRTRFHGEEEDSDAGSVRRYRIPLPEEKGVGITAATAVVGQREEKRRPGFWRRLSGRLGGSSV